MVNLSIKNVPEDIVEPLRRRARRNHRSLQGELLVILEQAVAPNRLTVAEAQRQLLAVGPTLECLFVMFDRIEPGVRSLHPGARTHRGLFVTQLRRPRSCSDQWSRQRDPHNPAAEEEQEKQS